MVSSWPLPQRIIGEIIKDIVPVAGRRTQETTYPVAILRKSGYYRDQINEISLVDVEVYSADLNEAEGLADAIFSVLIDGRSIPTAEGIMDRARCEVSPQEEPTADTDPVYRVGATYRVTTRRQD